MNSNTEGSEHKKDYAPLVEAMTRAYKNPTYQFHIPGHTKGQGVFKHFKDLVGERILELDTTDEFDNLGTLHPATGPIKEAEKMASLAFGAKRSFFLLNGSTIGNQALAMTVSKRGQKVIVNRNCHRSILTGLIMSGAEPCWVIPQKIEDWAIWGKITPECIEKTLSENENVACVWVTNPTYEGVVSDISAISAVCKRYNVPLIVDEAHGCLWNFSSKLPKSALHQGADAVVHSLHKTGGSMSQTSMLHVAQDSMIDVEILERTLKLLHTTSPSLLLLTSLDAARAHLQSEEGKAQIERAIKNADFLKSEIDEMQNVEYLDLPNLDLTKVFIRVKGLSGKSLEMILEHDYNIEVESASDIGILILSNLGNDSSDFEYLVDCLKEIDATDYTEHPIIDKKKHMPMLVPQIKMRLRDAYFAPKELINKYDAIGRISAEVVAECPPGVAILLPGELITEEHLPYLKDYKEIEVIKTQA